MGIVKRLLRKLQFHSLKKYTLNNILSREVGNKKSSQYIHEPMVVCARYILSIQCLYSFYSQVNSLNVLLNFVRKILRINSSL